MGATLKLPKQGRLLISEPFLHDPFFKRSVVLMVEHNDTGSLGFILNKPTGIMLNDALPDFPRFNTQLYFGGPVNKESLYYVHKHGDKIEGSIKIADDLFWGGDFEAMKDLIESGIVSNKDLRFFVGYSGWGPEQLKEEINKSGWIVSKPNSELSFSKNPNMLWRDVLKGMGSKYAVLANFPDDPSLN